jgi:putative transposase
MGYLVSRDDGWRLPDWLWERIEPLLPPLPFHPLGCCAPRVPDRSAMDAILLVLRTGMQWNALNATGVCSSSSAHRRFQEWEQAGVFHEIWRQGLLEYDEVIGIDWSFLAADGAMSKAPLVRRPENRAKPHRPGQRGPKRSVLTDAAGVPVGLDHAGANRNDHKLLKGTLDSIPVKRPTPKRTGPQGLCLDRAYDNSEVRELLADYRLTAHIRARGEEITEKAIVPGWRARRWVVEACHSWLNRTGRS